MSSAKQEKINSVIAGLRLELTLQDFHFDRIDAKNKAEFEKAKPEYRESWLKNGFITNKPVHRHYILNRQKLTEIIQEKLGFVDRRTVYSMIHYLLGQEFIFHNPTSQLSANSKVTMPTNDTKYELNSKDIIEHFEQTLKTDCTPTLLNYADKTSNPEPDGIGESESALKVQEERNRLSQNS